VAEPTHGGWFGHPTTEKKKKRNKRNKNSRVLQATPKDYKGGSATPKGYRGGSATKKIYYLQPYHGTCQKLCLAFFLNK
jgi:hypothetical protein